jgi:hypothetical protein
MHNPYLYNHIHELQIELRRVRLTRNERIDSERDLVKSMAELASRDPYYAETLQRNADSDPYVADALELVREAID